MYPPANIVALAKRLANGKPLPELAEALAGAAIGITLAAQQQSDAPTAQEIREQLDATKEAIRTIFRSLTISHYLGRLDNPANTAGKDVVHMAYSGLLLSLLADLKARAEAAERNVIVSGGTKPATNPSGLDAKQMCAALIYQACIKVRGSAPGITSGEAFELCEELWLASGQNSSSNNSLVGWRRQLTSARQLLTGTPASPEQQLMRFVVERAFTWTLPAHVIPLNAGGRKN